MAKRRSRFSRPTLFEIERGGALKLSRLSRLSLSGALAPDEVGNAVIRTRAGSGAANYAVVIEDARISGLTVNRDFDVVSTGKQTMADLIALRRVIVEDVSGAVISAAAERDDRGTYNAETVEIEDSVFRRVAGPAVDLYRGGTDESTFGPKLHVVGSIFERVGGKDGISLKLNGVQRAELRGNHFADSGSVRFVRTVGEPVLLADRNIFAGTPNIVSDVPVEAVQ